MCVHVITVSIVNNDLSKGLNKKYKKYLDFEIFVQWHILPILGLFFFGIIVTHNLAGELFCNAAKLISITTKLYWMAEINIYLHITLNNCLRVVLSGQFRIWWPRGLI